MDTKLNILNNILTVDTGDNTGIAYWKGNLFPHVDQIICPVWNIKKINTQLCYMWDQFESIILCFKNLQKVYFEGTNVYRSSLVSMTSATRGNLTKLNYLIGGYANMCFKNGIEFEIITAQQWKGQMSKEATTNKIKLLNGQTYSSEHITDAVGMGFGIMKMLSWRIEK